MKTLLNRLTGHRAVGSCMVATATMRLLAAVPTAAAPGPQRFLMLAKPLVIASMLVVVIAHITSGQAAAPPINDDFADAIRLTGTNVETSGSNVGATKEASEPGHAGNPGGSSVWWSWTADQTGYVTVSTWGSWRTDREPMDTLLGVYIGSSVSGLTLVANNDDRTDPVFGDWFGLATKSSQVAFIAKPGTIYYLAVDGYSEVDGSADEGTIQVALTVSSGRPPGPPQMGPAPDWALPDVKGAVVNWSDFSGRVVLVNFWATWCHSCLEEIPDLVALQQKHAPEGLSVIGISVDDVADHFPPPELVGFVNNNHVNYPIVLSRPSKAVEQAYGGITGIPVSFIVDRQNNIVRKLVDAQKEASFELYVKPLIYANLAVRASCTNGRVVLRWPLTKAEFGLEATDDLWGDVWTAQTEAVQSDASGHFVELTTEAPWRYFRLRGQ